RQDWSPGERYWRQALKGLTTPTVLGTARDPHDGLDPEDCRGEQETHLSGEAFAKVQSLARDNRLTLGVVLQGAWGLLLSHYSGQPDVVFGAVRVCRRT